jgi:hypothetical protein
VKPGETFYGISYDGLREARGGAIEIDEDGNARLTKGE